MKKIKFTFRNKEILIVDAGQSNINSIKKMLSVQKKIVTEDGYVIITDDVYKVEEV